jgi:hypothetical protein
VSYNDPQGDDEQLGNSTELPQPKRLNGSSVKMCRFATQSTKKRFGVNRSSRAGRLTDSCLITYVGANAANPSRRGRSGGYADVSILVRNRISIRVSQTTLNSAARVNRRCGIDVQVELALMGAAWTAGLEFNNKKGAVIFLNDAIDYAS